MIRSAWLDKDITDALAIRRAVFIGEQHVPEAVEQDGHDRAARHVVVYDGEKPVATGRMLVLDGKCILGRVAVLKEERGKRYGDFVVRLLIRKATESGFDEQHIHAQTAARGFYEKLGFEAYGDEFLEAGIRHISMLHKGDVGDKCAE